METKKTTLIMVGILAALLIVAGLMFLLYKPVNVAGKKTVGISITHRDGTTAEKELTTNTENLWDAMYEYGLIEGRDDIYGKWITAVGGETADEGQGEYWVFTKDGQWVTTACEATPIADGEHYEFSIYVS